MSTNRDTARKLRANIANTSKNEKNEKNLERMNLAELTEVAMSLNIDVPAGTTKKVLIASIEEAQG